MMAFKYIHTIVIAKISDRGRSLVWLAIALKTLKSKKKKKYFPKIRTSYVGKINTQKNSKSQVSVSQGKCVSELLSVCIVH